MRLLNENLIERFANRHADSRAWLYEWIAVVRNSMWRSIADVQMAFPAADGGVKTSSGAVVTIFDVRGNKYRLITSIIYALETVIVLDVLTHAEYSKNAWKRRH